ncbi:hypothetical protein SAMN05216188_1448 [Lentzea xinjiangensis]|uniref:Uncharacterized protein n=1 Tax=Lentzea xinjiangensis TaxID=402600 RepID=A0A1H9WUZ6_9PSEU|nr:hypothetical protein [Lentzea xinjiangensis]SES37517.1 hypothetical protein SAMN05216188_1448 [Lentzea xinjiangensis]
MTNLLIYGVTATFALLIGYSGYKAIAATDEQQRAAAYKVLKLVLAAVTGAGVLSLAVLHRAGVL